VKVFGEARLKSHLVKEAAKGKSVWLWMKITYITHNFKNSMFTAAVFLDIERANGIMAYCTNYQE
jgi:hypothetical protein